MNAGAFCPFRSNVVLVLEPTAMKQQNMNGVEAKPLYPGCTIFAMPQ